MLVIRQERDDEFIGKLQGQISLVIIERDNILKQLSE